MFLSPLDFNAASLSFPIAELIIRFAKEFYSKS